MNTLFSTSVPTWISILFLILIPIPFFLIASLAKKGAPSHQKNIVYFCVLGFFALFFFYVGWGSTHGFFDKVALPPTILRRATIPLLFFLIIIVKNFPIYKTILHNVQLQDIVKVHIFRLVGVFFLILAYHDTLPKFFAIVAGLGDMLTAIASIFIAKAITTGKPYAKKLTYIWNTFGLIDILFTAVSAFILTKISIDTGALGVDMLAKFPFCFIPALAPPTIIFLHIAIYKKLKKVFP